MSKPNTLPATGKLSDIMTAQAKIAMPEVVSIFLSKYETELYERKTELQAELGQVKKDKEVLHETVLSKADFSAYVGLRIPKLNVVSQQKGEVSIRWESNQLCAVITLKTEKKSAKNGASIYYERTDFEKTVHQDIPKPLIKQHDALKKTQRQLEADLQDVIAKISDMSRKERQVKARISELRLKEQGLEGFLADAEMQKLIAV